MARTFSTYRYSFRIFASRKGLSLKAEYYDNRDYAVAKLQWSVPKVGDSIGETVPS